MLCIRNNRRKRVALTILGFTLSSFLIYYFIFRESTLNTQGSCQALHPYKSVYDEYTDEGTGLCGLDPCKENIRYWSYAFLLAIFAGSLGGADFYMGNGDAGYKKLYLGVFSIIGLDIMLLVMIIVAKLIPAKHRGNSRIRKAYTLMTFVLSLLVGAIAGFLIILVYIIVTDLYSLYFNNRVDVNKCPLI